MTFVVLCFLITVACNLVKRAAYVINSGRDMCGSLYMLCRSNLDLKRNKRKLDVDEDLVLEACDSTVGEYVFVKLVDTMTAPLAMCY